MSEKIQLLCGSLYKDIPKELTMSAIPTVTELDYVGSEDFEATMLDKILPQAIKEPINFRELFEVDFYWVCRCLRLLNYGPYFTTNAIYCPDCNKTSKGEYIVDLRTVGCKTLPEGFTNHIVISKDEFLDYDKDVTIKLLTIQEVLNYSQDKAFAVGDRGINRAYARVCYSVKALGDRTDLNPIDVKVELEDKMSSADYIILKDKVNELVDYGLRLGGSTVCPACGHNNATYVALVDDRFLRPTLGDLKRWKADRSAGEVENGAGDKATAVRKHN